MSAVEAPRKLRTVLAVRASNVDVRFVSRAVRFPFFFFFNIIYTFIRVPTDVSYYPWPTTLYRYYCPRLLWFTVGRRPSISHRDPRAQAVSKTIFFFFGRSPPFVSVFFLPNKAHNKHGAAVTVRPCPGPFEIAVSVRRHAFDRSARLSPPCTA